MSRPKPAKEPEEFRIKEPGEDPEYDAWFREQVQIGLDQAKSGEFVSDEVVKAKWQKMRAKLRRQVSETE